MHRCTPPPDGGTLGDRLYGLCQKPALRILMISFNLEYCTHIFVLFVLQLSNICQHLNIHISSVDVSLFISYTNLYKFSHSKFPSSPRTRKRLQPSFWTEQLTPTSSCSWIAIMPLMPWWRILLPPKPFLPSFKKASGESFILKTCPEEEAVPSLVTSDHDLGHKSLIFVHITAYHP